MLPPDALATTDAKNDLLSFGVLAVGEDTCRALVFYGDRRVTGRCKATARTLEFAPRTSR
ncbi:hypothetical protein GCM10009613_13730 [Pseudonocardia kongjuensis]|uniref:Uncharacterized protein n=1 Tax=Pseudonocardia kongjuensis TaxID=102227 RepID=A0ABP4I7S2_9PSEU